MVINNSKFMTDGTFIKLANETVVTGEIPRLNSQSSSAKALEESVAAMSAGISGIVGTNFAINLATASSLNLLWGLIHSLEIVASFFLLNLRMPPNAEIMYSLMYDTANFSFLPAGDIQAAIDAAIGRN